jgi:adenine/guanine phosphoribosyltransferase-like PRPP-binding protein
MARWPREGIVLVDDLVVTGWTLRSLRGLLEQEGAEVSGMVSLLFREKWKDDRRF